MALRQKPRRPVSLLALVLLSSERTSTFWLLSRRRNWRRVQAPPGGLSEQSVIIACATWILPGRRELLVGKLLSDSGSRPRSAPTAVALAVEPRSGRCRLQRPPHARRKSEVRFLHQLQPQDGEARFSAASPARCFNRQRRGRAERAAGAARTSCMHMWLGPRVSCTAALRTTTSDKIALDY